MTTNQFRISIRKRTGITAGVLYFLFSSFLCRSQTLEEKGYRGELVHWNYFPFDSIWMFHPGNDTSAKAGQGNQSSWQKINTEFLLDENGKAVNWQGTGWFQKEFAVPFSWRGKVISFRMGHFGASEIYLDGKQIARYGTVANNIQDEEIFIPRKPVSVQLDSQASHKIDVRYSNQHASTPGYPITFTGFRLLLSPPDNMEPQSEVGLVATIPITVGILFVFGLFFLFVYFFEIKRLASLLTALLMFNFCAMFVVTYLGYTTQVWRPQVTDFVLGVLFNNWNLCLQVLVIYALYYSGKMPGRTWVVIAIMGFFVVTSITPSLFMLAGIASLLIIFELFRMIISGVRHQKSGFWILLIGLLIQQISFLVFVEDVFGIFPIMTPMHKYLLMILPQMGLPLPYALHLAWEFGAANRSLRTQLVQVNKLSETTLKQEQEKQEILTQQKDKLENMVTDRTRELSRQKEELQNTLVNLESTQAQLIHSEKMASLGELTAGIAHEIQNPLNFMNNFSEVNKELIEEMKHELLTGNLSEATLIANNIQQNEDKINHHGKRADAIVKGMLQHSQSSTGKIEPTDLNALTDEYLRLAYHGYRAKEKSFNATLKTNYDESIGKINIIPQDLGRVLLNLFNNAFYAVMQRKKTISESYEPAISVSTKLNNGMAEIRVVDNGNGIPKKLIDKIFQPFFTTKPTGQGTGLGLSLSYDIIKTQGGALRVESKEGEGAEFVVQVPTG